MTRSEQYNPEQTTSVIPLSLMRRESAQASTPVHGALRYTVCSLQPHFQVKCI